MRLLLFCYNQRIMILETWYFGRKM